MDGKEIGVSSYSIFSDATNTTKTFVNNMNDVSTASNECSTILSNESVFMGPIADVCSQEFILLKKSLEDLNTHFDAFNQYFAEVVSKYNAGDMDALAQLLQATDSNTTATGTGDGLVNSSSLASDYSIVNTKCGFDEFYNNVIQAKGLYQKSGGYSDWCLGFACTHAWGMYSNTTDYKASECNNSCSATNHFSRYKTNSEEEYMQKIYSEVSSGKPVVIQVCGSKSNGTRHYVTVVGFKNNVKSASELKDTDLLIVDSYDGKIESVVPKGSSGDGRYIIKGTDTSNYKKGNKNYNYGYELYSIT